ncbi:MAG TPA: hypothetical protein VGB84_07275 [Arachidicoccus sp.]
MKNLFSMFLFKNRSKERTDFDRNSEQNPWVKEGEYIYLHSKKGLYRVVSVNKEGFLVHKENWDKNHAPEFHSWDDFKRWSGRTDVHQD